MNAVSNGEVKRGAAGSDQRNTENLVRGFAFKRRRFSIQIIEFNGDILSESNLEFAAQTQKPSKRRTELRRAVFEDSTKIVDDAIDVDRAVGFGNVHRRQIIFSHISFIISNTPRRKKSRPSHREAGMGGGLFFDV